MNTTTATPAQIDAKLAEINAKRDALLAQLDALNTEAAKLEDEHQRQGWNRFYVVADGHVHSGRTCAGGSIRPTTLVAWVTDLSGKTEAEAVAQLGTLLCSHCFPGAPVELTQAPQATDTCTGSGQSYVPGTWKRNGPSGAGRATCTGCNTTQSVLPTHYVRKHKAKA